MLLDIIVNALIERDNRKRLKREYERTVGAIKVAIITATIRLKDRESRNGYMEIIDGLSDYLETEFPQGVPYDVRRMILVYYHKVSELYLAERQATEFDRNRPVERLKSDITNKAEKKQETSEERKEEKQVNEDIKEYISNNDDLRYVISKAFDYQERKEMEERSKIQNELEAQRLMLQTNLYMAQLINSQNCQINSNISQQIYSAQFGQTISQYIPFSQSSYYQIPYPKP